MRLLFVVQRYGSEIVGGSERCCLEFAERLADRGHDVHVATSCALGYDTWANRFPPGPADLNGVRVHRFETPAPRDNDAFGRFNDTMINGGSEPSTAAGELWNQLFGPNLVGFGSWLQHNAARFDVVIPFTYLYRPAYQALKICRGITPSLFHPLVHNEGYLGVAIFDQMFRWPTAFALNVEEEAELIDRRFGPGTISPSNSEVIGIGTELPPTSNAARFRERFHLGDEAYVLYVGRIDPDKGVGELVEAHARYSAGADCPARLVFVGERVDTSPDLGDALVTGFLDRDLIDSAMAGMTALVQSSHNESFSMVLVEAWGHRRPAIVQGGCDVLAGQARRSGGAVVYRNPEEYAAALSLLIDDRDIADRMGDAGHHYVVERYEWSGVIERYEGLLDRVRGENRPAHGQVQPAPTGYVMLER